MQMLQTKPRPTRKDQVLRRLERVANTWVNGSELATESVGGSEGHRRIRELRADGHPIEKRVHPFGARNGYQYRLVREIRKSAPEHWYCETCGTLASVRPQPAGGGLGLGKCDVCKIRRFFKEA